MKQLKPIGPRTGLWHTCKKRKMRTEDSVSRRPEGGLPRSGRPKKRNLKEGEEKIEIVKQDRTGRLPKGREETEIESY